MATTLPTLTTAGWTVTALLESLQTTLRGDAAGRRLALYQYAVTEAGWRALRSAALRWQASHVRRELVAFVGTDHGLTEPDALALMRQDGARVYLLRDYSGIYHPKVAWLVGPQHHVWVGSNNLTGDGLRHNIEFAVKFVSRTVPAELHRWADVIEGASVELDDTHLESYRQERRAFANRRSVVGTFTWSRRRERPGGHTPPVRQGDLVVEVMPRETGTDGKQVQLPVAAAASFFGLSTQVGASRTVRLKPIDDPSEERVLTMTVFGNRTVRLSIAELDYRDRPCIIVFHRRDAARFTFQIISQSVFPDTYRTLLARCEQPTRVGSRRWGIVL